MANAFQPLLYDHLEQHDFQIRDGLAMLHLQDRLSQLGYRLARPIVQSCLTPAYDEMKIPMLPEDLAVIDNRPLIASQLLVMTTRPPMDDLPPRESRIAPPKSGAPKRGGLTPSGTEIEKELFKALRAIFAVNSRSAVELTKGAAGGLKEGYESRREIAFSKYLDAERKKSNFRMATYRSIGTDRHVPKLTTCWYLFRVFLKQSRIPVIGLFGLSGSDTLAAAEAFSRDPELSPIFDDMVRLTGDSWRLVMVEVTRPSVASPGPSQLVRTVIGLTSSPAPVQRLRAGADPG